MSRLVLAALLLAFASPEASAMYKCVDARGVTHYSEKPIPGCKGGEVDIQGQPPISGELTPREDLSREEREFQRRRIDSERGRQAELKAHEAQKRRCSSMQAELQRMESGRRLRRVDEKGERVFVEDAERERRAAQLRNEIAQECRS